jgi:hypothetical protein
MDGKLHIAGLAYKYGTEPFDNIAILKKNLETHFRLDYLKYDWYAEDFLATSIVVGLDMNYAVPMLMLAEHYADSGEETRSKRWKSFAMEIGERAGHISYIQEYLEKKKF